MRTHPPITVTASLMMFILALFAPACGDGLNGANGQKPLFNLTTVEPGEDCPNGGVQIDSGNDENGNGVLDANEIAASTIFCQGDPGEDGLPGNDGNNGADGQNGANGPDGADGAIGTDGAATLITTTDLDPGDENCPHGGIQIDTGLDDGVPGGTRGNGVLEEQEIDETTFICNGAPAVFGEPFEPPEGPPGTYTINLSGGDGLAGDGGNGGGFGMFIQPGTMGGHIKLFNTGDADASFVYPSSLPSYLGEEPLEVTATLTVQAVTSHATLGEGVVYTHIGADDNVYVRDRGTAAGYRLITGIYVAPGITLTFELSNASETVAEIELENDFLNEGTVTTAPIEASTHSGGLTIRCNAFHGASSSTVTTTGAADSNGGDVTLDVSAAVFNEGAVNTSGGTGTNGGHAGNLAISASSHVFNTGDLLAFGGAGTDGNGGAAGNISISTEWGNIHTSGFLDSSGGAATTNGGDGGSIAFDIDSAGSVLNSGDLLTAGGDAPADCTDSCSGGTGAWIEVVVVGGEFINTGNLTTRGGFGAGGPGGNGGDIDVSTVMGSWVADIDDAIPAGDIVFSSDIDTSGGSGATAGNGGTLTVRQQGLITPDNQEIVFLGYTNISTRGGNGTTNGRDGGDVVLNNNQSSMDGLFFPSGGVVNWVTIDASGGDGADGTGGSGGQLLAQTDTVLSSQSGWELIFNYGWIDLTGGSGTTAGGDAGLLQLVANNGIENGGLLDVFGGHASAGTGGAGNDVRLVSNIGFVFNAGQITTDGGGCTADAGLGSSAGGVTAVGRTILNTGALFLNGGAGGTTGGEGGDGGDVDLFALERTVNMAPSIVIDGGTGETPGEHGTVLVDGYDLTETFSGEE